jgi:hypothetical protein
LYTAEGLALDFDCLSMKKSNTIALWQTPYFIQRAHSSLALVLLFWNELAITNNIITNNQ